MKPVIVLALAPILLSACATTTINETPKSACTLDLPYAPGRGGSGTVFEVLDQATAMNLLVRTQGQLGAPIDGAYINNVRVGVRRDGGGNATVLVPYGMRIAVGDHVAFQGGYRSRGLPCSYVPNLITRKF